MDNLNTTTLPGEAKKCNGVWLYIPDKKKVEQTVKDKFLSLDDK